MLPGGRPIGFSPAVELCQNILCKDIKFPAHGGRENEMATSVKQMMEAANAAVPKITPAQAKEMIAKGNTLVVDVRDGTEVAASGKVAGAVHVSRGLLEFRADPELPSHDKNFAKDKDVILYCGSGGRAALAGKLLKDLGYEKVYNLGGFKDWADSGGEIDN
jgi:rhodanese-related sulfurtransferase